MEKGHGYCNNYNCTSCHNHCLTELLIIFGFLSSLSQEQSITGSILHEMPLAFDLFGAPRIMIKSEVEITQEVYIAQRILP